MMLGSAVEQTVAVVKTCTDDAHCADLAALTVRCGWMWCSARIWMLQELTMLDTCWSMESACQTAQCIEYC